jgi:hypothetical protein
MAVTPIVNFRIPRKLIARIDAVRGAETRTRWVIRAIEAQLRAVGG